MARRSGAQRRSNRREIQDRQGAQRAEQSKSAARIPSGQPPGALPVLEAQPPTEIPAQVPAPRPAGRVVNEALRAAQRQPRPASPLPAALVPQPLPERTRDAHPAYGLTTAQWVLFELTRESMRTAAPDFPAVNQTLSDLQDLQQLTRRILDFRP
ncbi:hypothetical protein Daqu01_03503 [Deinococcus aquaticus]